MRRIIVVFAIFVVSVSLYGQKVRYGQQLPDAKSGVDYPIQAHIYAVHLRTECTQSPCTDVVYSDALVNGKRLEFRSNSYLPYISQTISLGDYRARIVKAASRSSAGEIGDTYELVVQGNKTLRCVVTGIAE
ncbi:hypothetical protein [Terracidiphilus gabretensis]|uniref:hypothetical protein n=1 Tax=Terracidiphilus gabretensis TaxID=1577687 RepID=UPI00071BA0F6|nr:hypothetical protein [Terracidiphilus gabretensis]